jgi:hypothetical protein
MDGDSTSEPAASEGPDAGPSPDTTDTDTTGQDSTGADSTHTDTTVEAGAPPLDDTPDSNVALDPDLLGACDGWGSLGSSRRASKRRGHGEYCARIPARAPNANAKREQVGTRATTVSAAGARTPRATARFAWSRKRLCRGKFPLSPDACALLPAPYYPRPMTREDPSICDLAPVRVLHGAVAMTHCELVERLSPAHTNLFSTAGAA